jgi:hypothetical protein
MDFFDLADPGERNRHFKFSRIHFQFIPSIFGRMIGGPDLVVSHQLGFGQPKGAIFELRVKLIFIHLSKQWIRRNGQDRIANVRVNSATFGDRWR